MKNKNKNIRWAKALGYAILSLFFVVSQILGVSLSAFLPSKNLSFDSAKLVLQETAIQDTRQTDDGNIIQRFYTGLQELPFVDYLVLTNFDGEVSYIPLRATTKFFEKTTPYLQDILVGDFALVSKKIQTEKPFLMFFIIVALFVVAKHRIVSYFFQTKTFLRQPLWLVHRHIRI